MYGVHSTSTDATTGRPGTLIVTHLHQVLAIEKGAKAKATRALTDAHRLSTQDSRLVGIARRYEPVDDDGEQLPPQGTKVQVHVDRIAEDVEKHLVRLVDVVATKNWANQEAGASIVVDGTTLVTDAPVTFLLWLEKTLQDVRTWVAGWPTLDPGYDWAWDTSTGAYRAPEEKKHRTKKVLKPVELSPATDKHPAQVATVNEDVIVGWWHEVKFSGAVAEEDKRDTLERIDKLAAAVKTARAEANTLEVDTVAVGEALFDFIFQ